MICGITSAYVNLLCLVNAYRDLPNCKLKCRTEIGYDGLPCDCTGFIGCEEYEHIGNVLGEAGLNLEVVMLHHLTKDVHIHICRIHARNHGCDDCAGAK